METEKTHTFKNAKKLISFFGFPNYVKRFTPNYSTLEYTYTLLKRTLTKGSQFWTETCI